MAKNRRELRAVTADVDALEAARGPAAFFGVSIPWSGLLFLLLATLAVYSPAMRGGYVWDDDLHVESPVFEKPNALRRIWIAGETAQYYPLTYTAFWIQRKLWGLHPEGYHLVNIFLHFLNAALVWVILKKLRIPGAGFAAAIFALHPVHVESVAWITELKNVLSGFFYLLSLASWLNFEDSGKRRWYWASLGLFLPALLSKTITCTLPAAFVLARWFRGRKLDWDFVQRVSLFLILGAAAAATTVGFEKGHAGDSGAEFNLSFAQRLIIASQALWFYAFKLAWPLRLVFNYERWVPDAGSPWPWLWPLAAAAAGACAWMIRGRTGRGPAASFSFFAIALFPALGFFYIYPQRYSFVADHFQYLSTIGPAALVAAVTAGMLGWDSPGDGARPGTSRDWSWMLLPAAALAVLGGLSWRQARTFRNSTILWQSVLRHNPASFLAHNNLGLEYAVQGRMGAAMDHYRLALKANPNFRDAHNNLGLALIKLGRIDEAEAHINAALRISPGMAGAQNNLGLIMASRGNTAEALRRYNLALKSRPGYALAYYNIGNVYAEQGKMDLAEDNYRLALEDWPDYADARVNLANTIAMRGYPDQAILEYQRALRAKSAQPKAHNNLANVLMEQGRTDEAIAEYRLALVLKPDFAEARNNLANALAESGRLDEAIILYRQAIETQPGFSVAVKNLERALEKRAKLKSTGAR